MIDEPLDPAAEPSVAEGNDLQAALQARAREAAEARERYLRTLADFDNYKKRMAREREAEVLAAFRG